jgi:hypothetical protein
MYNRSPIHSQSRGRTAAGLRAFSSATVMPVRRLMLLQLSPRSTV